VPVCMLDIDDPVVCGIVADEFYQPRDPAARYLNRMPHAKAIDTRDWYCVDDLCPAVIGNIYVYRDANHLSAPYVLSLAPQLWEEIEEFL